MTELMTYTELVEETSNITEATDSADKGETALHVLYAIIGCLGVLGNGLVIFVFLSDFQHFKSITNMLILNQSVIDFCNSVVFLILRLSPDVHNLPQNFWGQLLCRVWFSEYIMWSLCITSTVNLVFVSLERYVAVCHPVKHRHTFTQKRARIGVSCVWIWGFTYQSYWAILHRNSFGDCREYWPSGILQLLLGLVVFILEYLLPLSIMTFAYISIIMMLRKRSKSKSVSCFQRAKKNVTITLILVFFSYVICWTPTELTYLQYNLGGKYNFEGPLHKTVTILVLCNMCVNPFIYTFKYEQFKTQLKKIFCSCFWKPQITTNHMTHVDMTEMNDS